MPLGFYRDGGVRWWIPFGAGRARLMMERVERLRRDEMRAPGQPPMAEDRVAVAVAMTEPPRLLRRPFDLSYVATFCSLSRS